MTKKLTQKKNSGIFFSSAPFPFRLGNEVLSGVR